MESIPEQTHMETQPEQVSANPLLEMEGAVDRTRSNVPVSTHVHESCVISASLGDVWSALRSM